MSSTGSVVINVLEAGGGVGGLGSLIWMVRSRAQDRVSEAAKERAGYGATKYQEGRDSRDDEVALAAARLADQVRDNTQLTKERDMWQQRYLDRSGGTAK